MLNLTLPQLLAQGVTVVIIILLAICGQQKKQNNFLLLQIFINALYGVQYALLSAMTAVFICVVCVIRTLIFYLYKKQNKRVPLWLLVTIFAGAIGAGLLSWQNWLSIIPVLGTMVYTYGQWHKDLQMTRKTVILGDSLYISYNFYYLAIVAMITNMVIIGSIVIAIYRERKQEKAEEAKAALEANSSLNA